MTTLAVSMVTSPEEGLNLHESCPGCGNALHRALGLKNRYPLWQCLACDVIFTPLRNDGAALQDIYDHYYDRAHFETSPVVAASLGRLARGLAGARRTGRWLDIGFGEGAMLQVAERHGWACYGTEVSPQALEHGHRCGWVVSGDAVHDPRFPAAGFDVVTMIELLEHVTVPAEFLQAAAHWLRPGGLLYITTPNGGSLNRRLLGLQWSVFSPPEHLTIWSARGLHLALRAAGFRVGEVRTEGLNPSEILARWRSTGNAGPQPSRNEAGFRLNQAFSRSPLRRRLKAGINRCLSALGIGDTLKVRAIREPFTP